MRREPAVGTIYALPDNSAGLHDAPRDAPRRTAGPGAARRNRPAMAAPVAGPRQARALHTRLRSRRTPAGAVDTAKND